MNLKFINKSRIAVLFIATFNPSKTASGSSFPPQQFKDIIIFITSFIFEVKSLSIFVKYDISSSS